MVPKLIRGFLNENAGKQIDFNLYCDRVLTGDILTGLKEKKYDIGFCSKFDDEPLIEFIPVAKQDQVAAGFVANGFGIAIAPDIPILHSLDVKILPLVSPGWQRRFYMAMLKDVYHPPVVEEFKKFVIAQTREDLFYKKH